MVFNFFKFCLTLSVKNRKTRFLRLHKSTNFKNQSLENHRREVYRVRYHKKAYQIFFTKGAAEGNGYSYRF